MKTYQLNLVFDDLEIHRVEIDSSTDVVVEFERVIENIALRSNPKNFYSKMLSDPRLAFTGISAVRVFDLPR